MTGAPIASPAPASSPLTFVDEFGAATLDPAVWSPHHLPAWSSREQTRASSFDNQPERCGEICVAEVFGTDVDPGRSAEVGMGLHAFRDPHLSEEFAAPTLPIDVAEFHRYAVDWDAEQATFSVDGSVVRTCAGPPTYPMQLMLAAFDFPGWSRGGDDHLVPELVVDRTSARY